MQDLFSKGNEIASITHRTSFDQERGAMGVVGQAELLVQLGNIAPGDVRE